MNKRFWVALAALAYSIVGLTWVFAQPQVKDRAPAQEAPGQDIFGLTKVHQFHLELPAKTWERMQPAGGGMPFFGGRPGAPGAGGSGGGPGGLAKTEPEPDKDPVERHKGGSFGTEFPWAHADFTAEDMTFKNVGLRYKGGGSYMVSMGKLKRNLKIELEHYDADQRFHGHKTINLNAGAADPTRRREALAFSVYRNAGVPAPRTAYAEVTLTLPGKYDKEILGLYTVVEQVDKAFLKDRFKNAKGLLMKPEVRLGMPPQSLFEYRGDDWEQYKSWWGAKREPSKKEGKRVVEFAKLISRADDEQFGKEIDSYLDVDEFLRFLAVTAMLSNMDSFLTLVHNYYLYLNPETNRFVFIPWDLDLSFAGFPMLGSSEQQMELSLRHPYAGENKLLDRLLGRKDVSEKYHKLLRELATTCFAKEALLKDIVAVEEATQDIIERENKAAEARKEGTGGFGFPGMFGRTPDLRTFVERRTESIAAQLDGKSKGFVPAGFGFGGGPGGPGGRPGGRLGGGANFLTKPLMETLDKDKDGKLTKDELIAGVKQFFKDSDKDKVDSLDEKQIAAGINRIFPQPPGFGPPADGGPQGARPGGGPSSGPGGLPPGFGPGNFMAGAVLKRADSDKSGTVTLDELIAGAAALFQECDKDKSDSLDEKEFSAGFGLLFPPPPGFGVPNGPRGLEPPDQPAPERPAGSPSVKGAGR